MDDISIRYGESVTLPIDAGDFLSTSADIYIGKPGETYQLTKNTALIDGVGVFVLTSTETRIPLGTYYYQINVTDQNGYVEKYPSPEDDCGDCEANFPRFVVKEALDANEVS